MRPFTLQLNRELRECLGLDLGAMWSIFLQIQNNVAVCWFNSAVSWACDERCTGFEFTAHKR